MTDEEKKLMNAANGYAFDLDTGDLNTNRDTFIAGANWMKEQMMKDAMEINFDFDTINATLKYKQGKKIKLIIIKE